MRYFPLTFLFLLGFACGGSNSNPEQKDGFDMAQDLLLLHYDFKTDVDDLHSAAAFATLMADAAFSDLKYHAVAGTYGIQDGLYVPPNTLMKSAFGENWSDADEDKNEAVERVKAQALESLEKGGEVWIADGGQSDFSAMLVRAIQAAKPSLNTKENIHIVQHSDWNEEVTSPDALAFVKEHTDYQKIPDGNAIANGTPGFRTAQVIDLQALITDEKVLSIWQMAIKIANTYNGVDGRYLNEAVEAGGLDFSDFAEVCWILGLLQLEDANDFFETYPNKD